MYEDNPKNNLWKICTICDVPVSNEYLDVHKEMFHASL